jgi:predicted extracellular nuclease
VAVCGANLAQAVQYPPGGPGCTPPLVCADTLIKVSFIQNPAAAPHPVAPDTVWGIGGIITGFDTFPTGFAFYIQNRGTGGALPWSGVDVFTGGTNYVGLFTPPLALGDSVMCYGRLDEFQGGGELRGLDPVSAFNNPLVAVRRISQGNSLPPFRRTTVHELYELPTNLAAEQWEGCLVRVKDKMRVVRSSLDPGGIGTFSSMLVVDNTLCPNGSLGPCDSLFIDGSTLSFNAVSPLPHGALVDSVQGIYDQRTRGYRIQLRDASDMFDSSPPSFADAYFITPDTIRCIFDRNLTQASANNVLNYTVTSTLGPPDAAFRQVQNNVVHLKVTTGQSAGDPQGITANGLVNAANGQAMTSAQAQTMFEGICTIPLIQAPDPAALAGSPCDDRSKFAGAGSTTGDRITMRGVCITNYGSTYFLEDAAGGVRSGITVFAPIGALVAGHQYVMAGGIQEFFTETEFVGNVYLKDEGVVAIPAAAVQTVHVLRDTTCDLAQALSTSEDYEGMLVKVVDVKTTEERTAGQSFGVAGPYPGNPDTILIDNNITRTFDPTKGQYVTVTGVMDLASSVFAGVQWRIQPRNDADIVVNPTLNADPNLPLGVSFSITPNPARQAKVTFALPKRDHVKVAVFDIVGRRLATLADGEFPAGPTSLDWDGRDASGHAVGAGMYFYKMTVGGETYERRGVILN